MNFQYIRHIILLVFLSFSCLSLSPQIQHKQLRKDILDERNNKHTEVVSPVKPGTKPKKETKPKKLNPPPPVAPIRTLRSERC